MTSRVVDGPPDPAPLIRSSGDPACGALVVLSGPAGEGGADPAGGGDGVEVFLEELEEAALARHEVRRCRLALGRDGPAGEGEVVAVVRAPHRAAAFEAARWSLAAVRDRLGGTGDPA